MKKRNTINNIVKVALSLMLGGAILYWMYRGFDFQGMKQVLLHGMDWTWMLLSFPFGILAQAFRGWRWQQTLEPVGEKPRASVSVNSVFVSYAVSLLIPRVGEFARCGILRRWDGVSFPKALGTVVTERAIDSLLVLVMIFVTLLSQFRVFQSFFRRTGTRVDELLASFSSTGWLVTMICGVAVVILLWVLLRKMSIYNNGALCQECATVYLLLCCYLGMLFPPLLSHLLLLRGDPSSGFRLRDGHIHRRQYCCHRAHAQRCRPMAFCGENHAHSLWRGVYCSLELCAHRPQHPDLARRGHRYLWVDGTKLHQSSVNR